MLYKLKRQFKNQNIFFIQLIIAILFIAILAYYAFNFQKLRFEEQLHHKGFELSNQISQKLNVIVDSLDLLSNFYISTFNNDPSYFEVTCEEILKNFPDVEYIEFRTSKNIKVIGHPPKNNYYEKIYEANFFKKLYESADLNNPIKIYPIVKNKQNISILMIEYTLYNQNKSIGNLICYINIDSLIQNSIKSENMESFTILISNPDGSLFFKNKEVNQFSSVFKSNLNISNFKLKMQVLSKPLIYSFINKHFLLMTTCFLVFLSILIYLQTKIMSKELHIKELDDLKEELERIAYFDDLTGFPNRNYFFNMLQDLMIENEIAIFSMDLDDFKKINDTLGHDTGDELILYVSRRLQNLRTQFNLKEDELIFFRTGGDEFSIILIGYPFIKISIEKLAAKTLDIFRNPFFLGDSLDQWQKTIPSSNRKKIFITTSIGISLYPKDGLDSKILLKNADTALHKAKMNGKNRFSFYNKAEGDAFLRYSCIEEKLRDAIKKDELSLFFQPQCDIKTKSITGFEALLRWQNEKLGSISPSEFIPIAEKTGLIVELGEWILDESFRQAQIWKQNHFYFKKIAVNISSVQLRNNRIIKKLNSLLRLYGEDFCELIEIEITESTLFESFKHSLKIINKIKQLGFEIALDDFGTGYSSLGYLKLIPVSTLKLDKIFIDNMTQSEKDLLMVKGIIQLSHSLRLKVIAEGVENKEQIDILKEFGCDQVQGYYFCKPLSHRDVENFTSLNFGFQSNSF